MTVKLIKRPEQQRETKQVPQVTQAQMMRTAQLWIDEFKERKSKISLIDFAEPISAEGAGPELLDQTA